MKNLKTHLSSGIAALVLSLLATHLNAQTISIQNFDDPTTINSFATGSLDGFDFFAGSGTKDDFVSNPSYGTITNTFGGGDASDVQFSKLTVGGTTFYTGADYGGSNGTLTLTKGVSSFTIGALVDNGDYGPNNSLLAVSLYSSGGTLIQSKAFNDASDPNVANGTLHTNNFYFATISNAVAGDYISITGSSFGGVTVANATGIVPEPSTYALLGLGLALLLFTARSRYLASR